MLKVSKDNKSLYGFAGRITNSMLLNHFERRGRDNLLIILYQLIKFKPVTVIMETSPYKIDPFKPVLTFIYTPTAIMLARYVTHMNTQSPGGICYASLEVGWYSRYQPTSTKA